MICVFGSIGVGLGAVGGVCTVVIVDSGLLGKIFNEWSPDALSRLGVAFLIVQKKERNMRL